MKQFKLVPIFILIAAILLVGCGGQTAVAPLSQGAQPETVVATAVATSPAKTPPTVNLLTIGPGEEYNPEINPQDFTTNITNPYFSLPIGKKMVYESETPDGLETVEILVPGWTRTVAGVETLVFWDRVYLEGELIEDTRDYVAQHRVTGDVWYFGEHVDNYEDGVIVDHDGAWLTGEDNAKPGIWVLANPQVGDKFRNEYRAGEAEDESEVLSINETVTAPYGTFANCIQHLDGSPLFEAKGHAFLCPGAGVEVLGVDLVTADNPEEVTVELIEIDPVGSIGEELPEAYAGEGVKEVAEFADAQAHIEYNSTAGDLGFHVELDAPAWQRVMIYEEDGGVLFDVTNDGSVAEQGLTSLFFESAELPFDVLPYDVFLERFPAGVYTLVGIMNSGETVMSVMELLHNVPDPPQIILPAENEVVPLDGVVIAWEPVTTPEDAEIERYQVIVFPVDPPEGQDPIELDIDLTFELPAHVTQVQIPAELLMSGEAYQFEVIAVEAEGNKTLTVGFFSTG
jgi:hypothetical protein